MCGAREQHTSALPEIAHSSTHSRMEAESAQQQALVPVEKSEHNEDRDVCVRVFVEGVMRACTRTNTHAHMDTKNNNSPT